MQYTHQNHFIDGVLPLNLHYNGIPLHVMQGTLCDRRECEKEEEFHHHSQIHSMVYGSNI